MANETDAGQGSVTFVHLTARGDEAIRAVGQAINQILDNVLPAQAASSPPAIEGSAVPAPAIAGPVTQVESEPVEVTKQPRQYKRRKPMKREKPSYERPPDEPDGFASGDPPPTQAKGFRGIDVKPGKGVTLNKGGTVGKAAARIIAILDAGTGVAAIDYIAEQTGLSPMGVALTVGKCDRLKKVGGGRVALANWEEADGE